MTKDQLDCQNLTNLSHLARIQYTENELQQLLPEISRFLDYVQLLDEIDTTNVEPCYQVLDEATMLLRPDQVTGSLQREEFLLNAPQHVGGMVRVPIVL